MEPGVAQRFFISYAHAAAEDEALCHRFAEALEAAGHDVFVDREIRFGDEWEQEVERRLQWCDFFLLLLSETALQSEMVLQEVKRACHRRKSERAPTILTVRVRLKSELPYRWAAYLDPYQWRSYQGEADLDSILEAIQGKPVRRRLPPLFRWRRWLLGGVGIALIVSGLAVAVPAIPVQGLSTVFALGPGARWVAAGELQPQWLSASDTCDLKHFYCIELPGVGRFALPPNGVRIGLRPSPLPDDDSQADPALLSPWQWLRGAANLRAPDPVLFKRVGPHDGFVPCTAPQAIQCTPREGGMRCIVSGDGC
ncbi:MAG TPA: toll/interleukin-1 receptor domain-containing protein [Myxococcales bacterium]|jgi:hypothetical protein|nr:toll/interleukin-1 receptor domain-containing protein [Myxococcales bacterium]